MRLAQLLLLTLVVTGCAVGGPSVSYVADQRYQPTASVERLRAYPDRPYVALAELNWMTTEQTRREVEDRLAEDSAGRPRRSTPSTTPRPPPRPTAIQRPRSATAEARRQPLRIRGQRSQVASRRVGANVTT
jgi:hypothetical protein